MKIVITGASSGIGRALAKQLMQNGHSVWSLARSNQMQFVADSRGKAFASRCNVASWEDVQRAASDVRSEWEQVDCLITCAGQQGEVGPAMTRIPRLWSDTVRINLDGTFYSIYGFYDLLKKAERRPKIICFSGGGATKPRPNFSAYGVAKAAVVRLVETLAWEFGDSLDINAVAPGAINTRLLDEVLAWGPVVVGQAEYDAAVKRKNTGGDSLAKTIGLVEWLISQKSDHLSGRLISAQWDDWKDLTAQSADWHNPDVYTLRRQLPSGQS